MIAWVDGLMDLDFLETDMGNAMMGLYRTSKY